jgi:hypothetical protein
LPEKYFWIRSHLVQANIENKIQPVLKESGTQNAQEQLIFGMLFKVFHHFMEYGYNAQDRELLRSYLESLESIL